MSAKNSCEELVKITHEQAKHIYGCYDYEGFYQGGWNQDSCEIRRKMCKDWKKQEGRETANK